MRCHVAAAVLTAALAASGAAHAHEAFFARSAEDSAERPFVFGGARPARVVYVHAGCPTSAFHARIDASPGDVVYVALGVPALDELRSYRPTLYLVGPGLPAPEERPPFAIPEGAGVAVLPPPDEPRLFPDPVTGADSWLIAERRHVVSQRSTYRVVIDSPDRTGRFWLVSGRADGPENRAAIPAIRRFFDPEDARGLGRACVDDERMADETVVVSGGARCAIERAGGPAPAASGALFLALALALRARRRAPIS